MDDFRTARDIATTAEVLAWEAWWFSVVALCVAAGALAVAVWGVA